MHIPLGADILLISSHHRLNLGPLSGETGKIIHIVCTIRLGSQGIDFYQTMRDLVQPVSHGIFHQKTFEISGTTSLSGWQEAWQHLQEQLALLVRTVLECGQGTM